jgi:hypothetical protein
MKIPLPYSGWKIKPRENKCELVSERKNVVGFQSYWKSYWNMTPSSPVKKFSQKEAFAPLILTPFHIISDSVTSDDSFGNPISRDANIFT